MDRSEFIRSFIFVPVIAEGLAGGSFQETGDGGVRHLSLKRNFTIWRPVMDPAYHVKIGEVVLVEMSHGLPGSSKIC